MGNVWCKRTSSTLTGSHLTVTSQKLIIFEENTEIKNTLNNKKRKLKEILALHHGFLDQLVSPHTSDLGRGKDNEKAELSTLGRTKLLNELAEKLTSSAADRKEFSRVSKINNQHFLAESIELKDSVITPERTKDDAAVGACDSDCDESTVLPVELFKAAVLQRNRLVDIPHKTSRDADVIVLKSLASVCRRWKAAFSESGDLRRRRLKRLFRYNPQTLFTLKRPPLHSDGDPRWVTGVTMLDNCFYVVYHEHSKVEVFDCENLREKIKDIEVKGMSNPCDMVGSGETLQIFITENCYSGVVWRIDLKTKVANVFVKTGFSGYTSLSLTQNRLLVTSRDSLLLLNLRSGDRMKIPLSEDLKGHQVNHAIESNRDSFLVSHGLSGNRTVSEIDAEGRVIRVFDNKQQLDCDHLALDSVGRLFVTDWSSRKVVLLNEHLTYERIMFDNKRLDNARPNKLSYSQNNNRLMVGFGTGHVKIYECNVH